jgi:hypothetical protein
MALCHTNVTYLKVWWTSSNYTLRRRSWRFASAVFGTSGKSGAFGAVGASAHSDRNLSIFAGKIIFVKHLVCFARPDAHLVDVDWLATELPHKHCIASALLCAACVCFPPSTTGAPAPLRACGPLMEEPRTARAEQSPLLARKESFGRETTDRILSYRFDFHIIVRDF